MSGLGSNTGAREALGGYSGGSSFVVPPFPEINLLEVNSR